MDALDIYKKYNIDDNVHDYQTIEDLRNTGNTIQNIIHHLDKEIDNIPESNFTKINSKGEVVDNNKLYALTDERYILTKLYNRIYEELIKRKRKSYNSHNQKALNHGGIYYDYAVLEQPRVGMGFRGYRGVSL